MGVGLPRQIQNNVDRRDILLAQRLGPVSCLVQVQRTMVLVNIDQIRKRVGEQEQEEVARKQQSWLNSEDVPPSDMKSDTKRLPRNLAKRRKRLHRYVILIARKICLKVDTLMMNSPV